MNPATFSFRLKPAALGSTLLGLEPVTVAIHADVTPRAGSVAVFAIDGAMPPEAVREARVRLRSSFASACVALDAHDVSIWIEGLPRGADAAPLDLAIAAAVLRGLGREVAASEATVFAGELSLSGNANPIRGALTRLAGWPARGGLEIILPHGNAAEVGLSPYYKHVRTVEKLVDLLGPLERIVPPGAFAPHKPHGREDLRGSLRDVFDACCSETRILLVGPPGSGKTMLARRIASQAAPLSRDEALEVASVYSAAGILSPHGMSLARPFRAPHHTASTTALVGGGARFRPGEVSLAHRGVLLLDELPEFRRSTLEELARALREASACGGRMPAVPSCVVASANPCPCGYAGTDRCRCSPSVRAAYDRRLDEYASLFGMKRFEVSTMTRLEVRQATEVPR